MRFQDRAEPGPATSSFQTTPQVAVAFGAARAVSLLLLYLNVPCGPPAFGTVHLLLCVPVSALSWQLAELSPSEAPAPQLRSGKPAAPRGLSFCYRQELDSFSFSIMPFCKRRFRRGLVV